MNHKILLCSRDGLERLIEISGPLPPYYHCALAPRMPKKLEDVDNFAPVKLEVRRYGVYKIYDPPQPSIYIEQDEVLTEKPGPPKLTNDEWADAVARFASGLPGADWAEVIKDFYARHDGAEMIVHAKSGICIGAFYPSPQWQASDDAVAFFSALLKRGLTE